MLISHHVRSPGQCRTTIPVVSCDDTGAGKAPAGLPSVPAGAPNPRADVYVVHHPPHCTVHAPEGAYRNDSGRWMFSPTPFPKHGFPVVTPETLAWLDAEADLAGRLGGAA